MKTHRRSEGFTLLEILVVVMIIGLLTGLVARQMIRRGQEAKGTLAQTKIQQIAQALEMYRLDNGRYPTTEQGLEALVREPQSEPRPRRYPPEGYMGKGDLLDPWDMPYRYAQPGAHNVHSYDIHSFGPNGTEGGGDDVTNWDDSSE
jgi:general secretion pathway protein G